MNIKRFGLPNDEGEGENMGGAGGAPAGGDDQGGAGGTPTDWMASVPATWREELIPEDADNRDTALNMLQRVPDFKTLAQNYVQAQNTIRSGQISALQPPAEGATDAEIAEWRELHNVPESADKYELQLDDGLVLGDDDKAVLDDVFAAAHAAFVPSGAMSKMVSAFLKAREVEAQAIAAQDQQQRADAERVLKQQWGPDFANNINLIRTTFIDNLPESVRQSFEQAVLLDGRKMMNSPEVLVAMADWARQINPLATVLPPGGNVSTIDDEIKQIESEMGTPEYFKDEAKQARYRELITAKERLANQ